MYNFTGCPDAAAYDGEDGGDDDGDDGDSVVMTVGKVRCKMVVMMLI